MSRLSSSQRSLVSSNIGREVRLKRLALKKRRSGRKLSPIEIRRAKRTRSQLIRIGFEKARERDPTIPEAV